jgi:putative glutamate/gamma-aminobutyrate antiporter
MSATSDAAPALIGIPVNASSKIHQSPIAGKSVVIIGMLAFAVMNVTTIISLRGLPSMAEYGLTSIFYYVFAAVVFLIPTALVSAELASAFPEQGGVFRWVGEALGPRWGFAAIYYQWQAIVIWFPTVLIFAAAALAYIWWPLSFDRALAGNKIYTIVVLLAVYWAVTWFTFRGIKASSQLSFVGGLFGTIIPGSVLIILGIAYVALGKPIALNLHGSLLPNFGHFPNLVLGIGVFLYFAGMEMQAVHVQNLKNPGRDYPLSVLIATVIVVVLFILGTLAVSLVIAPKDIDLNQSLLTAYRDLWAAVGAPWLGNAMAALMVLGVLGQVSVIVAGPSTGILAVGKAGYLPHILQKTNANGIPVNILVIQGLIVTLLCAAFTVLPSVQSAYQILSQMATVIYLLMYLLMYVAAIRLRYTQPEKRRSFKIPGGMAGIWSVGILGLLAALLAITISFIPPSQISTGSPAVYIGILLVGCALFAAVPFVVYATHKKSWKSATTDFTPFDWQLEGRLPGQVSHAIPNAAAALLPLAPAVVA